MRSRGILERVLERGIVVLYVLSTGCVVTVDVKRHTGYRYSGAVCTVCRLRHSWCRRL